MSPLSAKVTSKGQITLPAKLRAELGLKPGDRVDFHRTRDGRMEMTANTRTLKDLRGIIKSDVALSMEELDRAISEAWSAPSSEREIPEGEEDGR
jgi:AbrB family looped-hinge helix DNA binding protein